MKSGGILALWLLTATVATAAGTAPRIAVVTGADSENLSALVLAQLAQDNDLSLVERDDLVKVGDEARLQQMANANAVDLGHMLNSDGLLFLNTTPDGIEVRFTATGLGYALFDDRYAANADLPHLATTIAQRVEAYAPKLKLKPNEAVPISVLNLRSDVATTTSTETERKVTLLVESRLASLPKCVVVERRHASALKFENSLSGQNSSLLQGVSVIDGSLTLPGEGKDEIVAHLRLRAPGCQSVPLEINGSMKDLKALADAAATAIGAKIGATGAPGPWETQKEAREYLLEGIWGYQHDAIPAALEALDSAELLGETANDLSAIRIPVLCAMAVDAANVMHGSDVDTPDDLHPEAKVEAMLRAIDEATRYESGNLESSLQVLDTAHSSDWRAEYLRSIIYQAGSSLLVMLDRTHSPQADEVRSALRAYAGFDPLQGKLPAKHLDTVMRCADSWCNSMDEELGFYRSLCAMKPGGRGWWMVPQELSLDRFCTRFIPDPGQRHAALIKFAQGLQDDPATKLAGLFILANTADPGGPQQVAAQNLFNEIWAQRDSLSASGLFLAVVRMAFDVEIDLHVAEADQQLMAILHYELQHAPRIDIHVENTWHPELFPAKEAPALWKEMQDLEARSPGDPAYVSKMRQRYIARFGNPESVSDALVVASFWHPDDVQTSPRFGSYPIAVAPDGVWLSRMHDEDDTHEAVMYHVTLDAAHPDQLATEIVRLPDFYPQELVATTDTLYAIGELPGQWTKTLLARYDLASKRWETHDIPIATRIFLAGNQIYLGLSGAGIQDMEGGVARYDDKTNTAVVLASSRRRPAQNQFDDREAYVVKSLFAGPGGKPCASIGFGETFCIDEKPGTWQRLIPSGMLIFSAKSGTRTLLYGNDHGTGDVAFMVDSTKPNPELWLGVPGPLMGTRMGGSPAPLPPQPAWSQTPVWAWPAGSEQALEYGFHDADLFGFVRKKGSEQYVLAWYRRGQAAPVTIPLDFKMNENTALAIKKIEDAGSVEQKRFQALTTPTLKMYQTAQGLCFYSDSKGFWFLPYEEVEKYLKAHASETLRL